MAGETFHTDFLGHGKKFKILSMGVEPQRDLKLYPNIAPVPFPSIRG